MTNELYLKRDDVLNLFKEYQPRLAIRVYEFGEALKDLKFRTLESQPCEDAISREAVIRLVEQYPNIIGNRCSGLIADIKHLPPITPSYNSVKTELKPCEDCISREETLNKINELIAEYIPLMPTGWTLPLNIAKTINELPSVQPQPKIDEIIKRIEEARDKDQIAEYPYNRCIKIIREVLGDD